MSALQAILADRESPQRRQADAEDAARGAMAWVLTGNKPEDRLPAFDAWIRRELATRLDWAWAGAQRERRIEQCRVYLERLVLGLWRRGWLLDGHRLAAHLTSFLDSVGTYQRKGGIADFWAYFCSSANRYVGANAEEIQLEAKRAGVQMGQLLGPMIARQSAKPPPAASLPELVAQRAAETAQAKSETLRAKIARQRARNAARKAPADQVQMLLSNIAAPRQGV